MYWAESSPRSASLRSPSSTSSARTTSWGSAASARKEGSSLTSTSPAAAAPSTSSSAPSVTKASAAIVHAPRRQTSGTSRGPPVMTWPWGAGVWPKLCSKSVSLFSPSTVTLHPSRRSLQQSVRLKTSIRWIGLGTASSTSHQGSRWSAVCVTEPAECAPFELPSMARGATPPALMLDCVASPRVAMFSPSEKTSTSARLRYCSLPGRSTRT